MAKFENIEGIGQKYAGSLRKAGIGSSKSLLKKGSTPRGREEISRKSGINKTLILEWVNHVDLFRIKGVGQEYADLLEEAGVDTIPELAQRNANNLYTKILETNKAKHLVRRPPSRKMVHDWVNQAQEMPRMIKY